MKTDPVNLLEETEEERLLRRERRRQTRVMTNFDEFDLARPGVGHPLLVARLVALNGRSAQESANLRGAEKFLNAWINPAHLDPDEKVTMRRLKREAQASKEIAEEALERLKNEIATLRLQMVNETED